MAPPASSERVGAIIVAAGASQRMGGVDKAMVPLLGKPLVSFAMAAFQACTLVDDIVLVLATHNLRAGQALVGQGAWDKVRAVCTGGLRRQDSVREGLRHLPLSRWVIVHDGARPCIEPELIRRGLGAVRETGAAVSAVPVKDTIKVVAADGIVTETPDRAQLWAVQTPQVFLREMLERAHREVTETVTDDAALVERLGYRVKVFPGSNANLKVTTQEDLVLAQAILATRGAPPQ